jgi:hypothetical protein
MVTRELLASLSNIDHQQTSTLHPKIAEDPQPKMSLIEQISTAALTMLNTGQ